ncbi:MAG: efflux transporter outer membrane subunit [Sphingomonas sp.]|uniref:efflux transporter outer membrane subunit n=1 Tax=Sphingomonas sp. TaxID=28214 RepID=UPI0022738968|nr:efflux transporter outer membrane subunit [Sphingomonas sp.]MCX8475346.1 efflux transporter outer membrane subunit [Sphingomonas sp.]
MARRWPGLLPIAALAGCNLAPPYERPTPPVPPAFDAQPGGTLATEIAWQNFFGDPRLRFYIAAALANNRDLAASTARIAQARAQFRIQNAARLPQIDASASAGRSRSATRDAAGNPISVTSDQFGAQVAVSAFELDFWGRVANLSEAARRQYLATGEARRAFRLSLISNVAATYYAIRSGSEGVALADRTLATRRETLEIARLRLDAGVTSTIDYDQANALVTQAEIQRAELVRVTEQLSNQLLVLIGGPAEAAPPPGRPIADAGQFEALDPGLPSALLANRPDILQAEHQLRAANANIGAARAALFPSISLTGSGGVASTALSSLFDSPSRVWSFGLGGLLSIFDWGRRRAQVDLSRAQRDELVALYQRTVQNAFREVADGLVGRQRLAEQIVAQEQAVRVQGRLAETSKLRYDNGVSPYLEVLDAQRGLFAAEQALLQLRAAALQNGVSLYAALGGGNEPPPAPAPGGE